MHISWLGNTALKIQAKPLNDDVTILIDPYKSSTGTMPRSLTAQLVVFSRGEQNAITISGDPFTLATPGECDVKGVLATAVEGRDEKSTMLRIDAESVSVGHLGLTNQPLTDRQEDVLTGVDVLCIPVGHPDAYDNEQAVKIVNTLEPRIIIPIAFQSDIDPKAQTAENFIKELGMAGKVKNEKKIIVKKKDLPQEDMEIVVLTKE